MKKILILGAANDQIPLIITAKELGYFVVVCDFTDTNPGLKYVDKHYQVSYLDKESVLTIAKKESIDGVISNSEQAMITVAYVSEQMNLIGNAEKDIQRLIDKTKFRKLQKEAGCYTPQHFEIDSTDDLFNLLHTMQMPVLMKPCSCSASRGTFIITSVDDSNIKKNFDECKRVSWNGRVAIEEFVEMSSLRTYEGDVFIHNGKLLWDGLFYVQRSKMASMIPMTYIGPLDFNDSKIPLIHESLTKIFQTANIKHGQYNVELFFTPSGELFIIEVNSRQGGRELPAFINKFCGVDMTKLLVSTCVGDNTYFNDIEKRERIYKYVTHHLVLCPKNGVLEGIHLNQELEPYFEGDIHYYKQIGSYVEHSVDGTNTLCSVDFTFPSLAERNFYSFSLEDNVFPILK